MKTLVSGGTGFIGKHHVRFLLGQGFDVRMIVRKKGYHEKQTGTYPGGHRPAG